MSSEMQDYPYAMRFRDLLERLAMKVIDRERPRYRYGYIQSIDAANNKCTVLYEGETVAVSVSMGAIQPSAVNQRVRVAGIGTDRFIDDVFGQAAFEGYATTAAGGSWGVGAQFVPNSDWNQVTESGIWMASGAANAPTNDTTWYIGYATVHNEYWQTQEVWQFTNVSADALSSRYIRRSYDSGGGVKTWGAWFQVTGHGLDNPDPTWTDATLTSPWVNYDNGVSFHKAGYRMMPDGSVRLRGLVKSGSLSGGTIFTLPAKYRPTKNKSFLCVAASSGANSQGACRVDVNSSGTVIANGAVYNTLSSNNYLSLEGISYDLLS